MHLICLLLSFLSILNVKAWKSQQSGLVTTLRPLSLSNRHYHYTRRELPTTLNMLDNSRNNDNVLRRIIPNAPPKTILNSSKQDLDANSHSLKQDFIRSLSWMGAATGFAAILGALKGPAAAIEFSSGYILELCLSIDNLFVFLVLFEYFKVKDHAQQKVLTYGIFGAMVLRGLFILMGSVAIQQFHQVLLLFSAVLAYSSLKILLSNDEEGDKEDFSKSPLIKFSQEFFRTTPNLDGDKFFTVENGVRMATPLFICVICVELSDILFAFDSVPAIFGVTQDPVVVYTSNIFAICGLRSLYSILSKAVSELKYLEKAVGLVLGVIAAKLGFETFDIEILTPLESLFVVLGILGVGIGASLWDGNDEPVPVEDNSSKR